MVVRKLLAAIAVAVLAASAWSHVGRTDEPAPVVPRGESSEPAPYRFDWADVQRAAPAYAGYDAWYPLWKETHELLPDGVVLATTHVVAVANNRHALDMLGDWPLWFDPSCESISLNAARLHKPGGEVREVADDDIQVRDDNTDHYVFVPDKVVIVSLSGLEVGDAIEIKYTRRIDDPQLHGHLCGRHAFAVPDYPVDKSELNVRLPKDRALSHAASGVEVQPQIDEDETTRTFAWAASRVMPAVEIEHAPHDYVDRPVVEFSTYGSWEEVVELMRRLRSDRSECSPAMLQELARVTEGCSSPREKARALAIWARDKFRYLSIHHGAYGFRPHPPDLVLAKRFGDCKDLCHLLYVLLKKCEVPVEQVLLSVDGETQLRHEIPSPLASHVVLLARIDGEEIWIDPTSTTTAWNRLRTDLFGRRAFAVSDEGHRLLTTPSRAADLHRYQAFRQAGVGLDKSIDWRVEETWSDYAADDVRTELLAVAAHERRRALFDEHRLYSPRARVVDEEAPISLDSSDKPLRVEFAYHEPAPETDVDDILRAELEADQIGGGDSSEEPAGVIHCLSPQIVELVAQGFDVGRAAPWRVDGLEVADTLTVTLPVLYEPAVVTAGESVESQWGSASLEIETDEKQRQLVLSWRLRCEAGVVAPEQFDEYQQFLDSLETLAVAEIEYAHALELSPRERRELRNQLAGQPPAASLAVAVAESSLMREDEGAAREAVRLGLAGSPDNAALLAWQARVHRDPDERLAALRRLVELAPETRLAPLAVADGLLAKGEAAKALTAAKEARAKSGPAHIALSAALVARCHLALKSPRAALDEVKDAIREQEENGEDVSPQLLMLKGSAAAELKEWTTALAAFESASDAAPEDSRPLAAAIGAALSKRDVKAARRFLRPYVVLADSDPDLFAEAADLCLRCERFEDALEFAQLVLEQDRADEAAKKVIEQVKKANGD